MRINFRVLRQRDPDNYGTLDRANIIGPYARVSKQTARMLFDNGVTIVIVPCKNIPDPYNYMSQAMKIAKATFNGGDTNTFDNYCDDVRFYNCNYETGYYPAHYVEYYAGTVREQRDGTFAAYTNQATNFFAGDK